MKHLIRINTLMLTLAVTTPMSAMAQTGDSLDLYAGVVSDYVFRGYSQSNNRPAVQAGAEYRHSLGLYAGTFVSSVDTEPYQTPGRDGSRAEVDAYAGWGGEIKAIRLGLDAGVIAYRYDKSRDNFDEAYASASFDPWRDHITVIAKASYDWDNEVLTSEAKGIFNVGKGFDVKLHPGYVRYNESGAEDYVFVTVSAGTRFDFQRYLKSVNVDIGYTDTDKDEEPDNNKDLVHGIWWVSVMAHF